MVQLFDKLSPPVPPFHDSRHNTSLRYLICTRNNTRPRGIDCERFEIQSKTSYRFGLNVCVRIRPGKLAAPSLCRIATSALPPRPPLSTLFSRYSRRSERNSCRERIENSSDGGRGMVFERRIRCERGKAKGKTERNGRLWLERKDNTSSKGTLLDRVSRLLDPRDVPTRICADMLPVIF